jgi:hypothetical protein
VDCRVPWAGLLVAAEAKERRSKIEILAEVPVKNIRHEKETHERNFLRPAGEKISYKVTEKQEEFLHVFKLHLIENTKNAEEILLKFMFTVYGFFFCDMHSLQKYCRHRYKRKTV